MTGRLARGLLLAALAAFSAGTLAPNTVQAAEWLEEFIERPEADGGDIRYAILFGDNGQSLQLGCVRNRIERVLIGFPAGGGGVAAPIARTPKVEYSFDNEAYESADWPLFEAGSIEVPRGAQSSAITRRIMRSLRFKVRANATDGQWIEADFNVLGGQQILTDMLDACGLN